MCFHAFSLSLMVFVMKSAHLFGWELIDLYYYWIPMLRKSTMQTYIMIRLFGWILIAFYFGWLHFCCDQHKVIWIEYDEDFVSSIVKREHIINTRLMALYWGIWELSRPRIYAMLRTPYSPMNCILSIFNSMINLKTLNNLSSET